MLPVFRLSKRKGAQRVSSVTANAPERVRTAPEPGVLPAPRPWLPLAIGALAFVVAFAHPAWTLGRDWLTDPEAGHGLLLAPLALYLAWRSGVVGRGRGRPLAGLVVLAGSLVLRCLSGLAAELFTMRLSMLGALAGLVIFVWGWGQLKRWWLPALLLLFSIPLPVLLTSALALPLQLQASRIGAALLSWRQVPVLLSGNVINLPGRSLFVTEACSGLRSMTALLALGVLVGGLWLRTPLMRLLLVLSALPVAVLLNGVRVFLTGFLVFFVDPKLGDGFMHLTEGWLIFVVAFAFIGAIGWVLGRVESLVKVRGT